MLPLAQKVDNQMTKKYIHIRATYSPNLVQEWVEHILMIATQSQAEQIEFEKHGNQHGNRPIVSFMVPAETPMYFDPYSDDMFIISEDEVDGEE